MANTLRMRRLFVVTLSAALLLAATPAGAFPHIAKWWQYDVTTWKHTWKSEPKLRHTFNRWERNHPDVTDRDVAQFTDHLNHRYQKMHFHKASGVQSGGASWFSASHGYCTPHMTGLYAASRTLPCGTQVSVRSGDRYVIVTIEDRGPFVSGRILDLSKKAFKKLSPLGAGAINVKATILKS